MEVMEIKRCTGNKLKVEEFKQETDFVIPPIFIPILSWKIVEIEMRNCPLAEIFTSCSDEFLKYRFLSIFQSYM